MGYEIPSNLFYSKTHEWVKLDGEVAVVGITDYAQQKLGDVVYVELPERGVEVKKGEKVCEVESVKTVAEIYAPLSGVILEVNVELSDSPELINESPYSDGWIFKLKIKNTEELKQLLDNKGYEELISHED